VVSKGQWQTLDEGRSPEGMVERRHRMTTVVCDELTVFLLACEPMGVCIAALLAGHAVANPAYPVATPMSMVRHATVSMATRRGTCHVSGRHGTVAIYS
jgi:hypothetical protein